MPENELFADLHSLSRDILTIGLAGFAVCSRSSPASPSTSPGPCAPLAQKTTEIAKGNLDVDLPAVRGTDEVCELSRSFHDMRNALKDYIANLTETTKAKERMESELKIAKNIQMTFCPSASRPSRTSAASTCTRPWNRPREVGGDLYDFFLLDDSTCSSPWATSRARACPPPCSWP